jgi:sugar transferase (PEP-CTERM/EpsH1 system associated)
VTSAHKVLHLITELDTGGAQKALARLLPRLDRSRFDPSVACLYNGDGPVADEIRALGIRVTDLGMTAKWRWDALWRLYRLLRRERPALLHTWMFHANIPGRVVGRLAGVPIILTSRRNVNIGGGQRELLSRLTSGMDDLVIAVCELARQAEIERAGVSPEKVVTVYNGLDAAEFAGVDQERAALVRQGLAIPRGTPVVAAVGRLHPQKDFPTLLRAMARVHEAVPGARLLVVGDGMLRGDLEAQARSLELSSSVVFTGQRADVPELLNAVDLFALSSLWEGLPNVVLEAMAAGLPVVGTRVGGVPEVVVDGVTGILVPPRDPEALASGIAQLLSDSELSQRMGDAGRARVVEQYSVERMVRETEVLYEGLLAKKGVS